MLVVSLRLEDEQRRGSPCGRDSPATTLRRAENRAGIVKAWESAV